MSVRRYAAAGVWLAAAWLGACATPPLNRALVVRDPLSKCALITFSGCPAFMPEAEPANAKLADEDAGPGDAR